MHGLVLYMALDCFLLRSSQFAMTTTSLRGHSPKQSRKNGLLCLVFLLLSFIFYLIK
jgi:hypothetical protein